MVLTILDSIPNPPTQLSPGTEAAVRAARTLAVEFAWRLRVLPPHASPREIAENNVHKEVERAEKREEQEQVEREMHMKV
jgi:hypothetical protein